MTAAVNVTYGGGRTARFEDQIITGPMSEGGDSGSLLVDADELKAVGLLFAGSAGPTGVTHPQSDRRGPRTPGGDAMKLSEQINVL